MSAGAVIWFTGLPASGKSTLALRVARALAPARPVVLDSDALRTAIAPGLGYGPASRAQFYGSVARLAALLAAQGHLVLVAATAQRRAFRAYARRLTPRFLEVYVEAPASVCARRDVKGLYRRVPGLTSGYEPPRDPDVIVRGGRERNAAARVVQALQKLHRSPRRAGRSGVEPGAAAGTSVAMGGA